MEAILNPRAVYFFGCDMGGWQNTDDKEGDALAVCMWLDRKPEHVVATAEVQFFPVDENSVLNVTLDRAIHEGARVIVAIDGALGWPMDFSHLVSSAPEGIEYDTRRFDSAIENPYLYRETDRFIKTHVRKAKNPLSAPGDRFGNNSSKAQMLVAWFRKKLPSAYRPPFGGWDAQAAKLSDHTIIEVYPDASLQSKAFEKVRWPAYEREAGSFRVKDIDDAKVCSLTAICYAMEVGLLEHQLAYPRIFLPDNPLAWSLDKNAIVNEGWIFAPYASVTR